MVELTQLVVDSGFWTITTDFLTIALAVATGCILRDIVTNFFATRQFFAKKK